MSKEINSIPVIKRESLICSRGGGSKWPLWMFQLICKLIVNGTSPSSVPSKNASMKFLMHGSEVKDIPPLRFIWESLVVLKNISETLIFYRLNKAKKWEQSFTDESMRHQISLQDFVVAL